MFIFLSQKQAREYLNISRTTIYDGKTMVKLKSIKQAEGTEGI